MFSAIVPQLELSKYDLIDEIGHGGMATVYRAKDRRLGREVAVKLLHRHLRESAEVEARFNSEARAVAKLKHPNIVEVFDVSDPDEPEHYLVVELIRGVTLRDLLKREGALPVELAAEIVLELTSALEHAHDQGVIHRDVKPENVLLESVDREDRSSIDDLARARVKLTDFGIAKLLDSQGVTSTGQVLGSPAHMAPEQIEGKVVDVRADVFSLGVLFYECVVGKLPFAGNNPAQVLRNVLDGNFDAPVRALPEVGDCWSSVISRALRKEPAERFSSIREFGLAIRKELSNLGFEHPRQDITSFLLDPTAYRETFPARLIAGLVRDANQARAARQIPRAASQFSRALAYSPGDPDLLRQVSGLRRRDQMKRGLWGTLSLMGVAGLAVTAFAIWPKSSESISKPALVAPPVQPNPSQEPVARASVSSAPAAPSAAPKVVRTATRRKPLETPPEPSATRQVSVRVTGAVGGGVRIDGRDLPWFGVLHDLTEGEHVFEFIPPDETCCRPTRRTVTVTAGEGPQVVVGRIPFKAAGLQVTADPSQGWVMSCPALFRGALPLPVERSVPMNQLQASGSCTFSNSNEGSAPGQKLVTLRAGNTTVLTWP